MKTRVLMGAVAAGAMCAGASASTLTLKFNGVGPSVNVNYSYFDGTTTTTQTTAAGVFNWTNQANGTSVKSFCVQLNENIANGNIVTYNVVSPNQVPDAPPSSPGNMGAVKATVLRDLFARFYSTAVNGNGTLAAAFQILVWEISHETISANMTASQYLASLSVASGDFLINLGSAASNAARTQAANWLAQLGVGGFKSFGIAGLTHPEKQDQVIVVPVPAPALLAGLGLIGAVAVRRRLTKA